jgi:hypothetical protein
MEVVTQVQPLSMGWCLDCHRDPAEHIRPDDVPVTEMLEWHARPAAERREAGEQLIKDRTLSPPTDCSACHR